MPFYPANLNARVAAQGGCFTLHGFETEALERLASLNRTRSLLIPFRIPGSAKPSILRGLRTLGVTESLLFPDLDGLAREARMLQGDNPLQASPADAAGPYAGRASTGYYARRGRSRRVRVNRINSYASACVWSAASFPANRACCGGATHNQADGNRHQDHRQESSSNRHARLGLRTSDLRIVLVAIRAGETISNTALASR